jgi:hypothetical protein
VGKGYERSVHMHAFPHDGYLATGTIHRRPHESLFIGLYVCLCEAVRVF